MPKSINVAQDPDFESDLIVPSHGDPADASVVEVLAQRLLNNTGFVKTLAESVAGNLTSHANAHDVHGAVAAAMANRLVLRDANGRAKFGSPEAADDAARLGDVSGAINSLDSLLRDPSNWAGKAGFLLGVNPDEDGLEAIPQEDIFSNISLATLPSLNPQMSFHGSSSDPTVTLSRNAVRVFMVGQLAFVSGRVSWSGLSGGSGTFEMRLSIPETAPTAAHDSLHTRVQGLSMFDISDSAEVMTMQAGEGYFTFAVGRGQYSGSRAAVGDLSSSGDFTFSGWYQRKQKA